MITNLDPGLQGRVREREKERREGVLGDAANGRALAAPVHGRHALGVGAFANTGADRS